jgi:hypothetical protein
VSKIVPHACIRNAYGRPLRSPDDEPTREQDRLAVRGIPTFLAKAGYQVEKL